MAVIPNDYNGLRFDVALAKLFPQYSRVQLGKWWQSGFIAVNPPFNKIKDKVQGGEEIQLDLAATEIKNDFDIPENIPLGIIYEDEDLLIVDKAVGLVVHPGAGNKKHTLVNALLFYCPELALLPRAGIVHRLDKDTSGLLIVAKNLLAYNFLVRQMQQREIKRNYLALVYGKVIGGGKIVTKFGRDPKNRLKMAVKAEGKEAITFYKIKQSFNNFSLLELGLYTGRTHQIRVHLAYIKHPVVGDLLYAGKQPRFISAKSMLPEIKKVNRQLLHAYQLQLTHPVSLETLIFLSPMPEDLQHILSILVKNG